MAESSQAACRHGPTEMLLRARRRHESDFQLLKSCLDSDSGLRAYVARKVSQHSTKIRVNVTFVRHLPLVPREKDSLDCEVPFHFFRRPKREYSLCANK